MSVIDDRRKFFESLKFPEHLTGIQKFMEPYQGLQKFMEPYQGLQKFMEPSQQLKKVLDEIASPLTNINDVFQNISSPFLKIQESLSPFHLATQSIFSNKNSSFDLITKQFSGLGDITVKLRASSMLESSGWMVHRTTPMHIINFDEDTVELIADKIENFYTTNWEQSRANFEEMLEGCCVDDEAKAAFREALSCHESGNYRATCKLLFPEIERLTRSYFHPMEPLKRITSVESLKLFAGTLTSDQIQPAGYLNFMLFGKLEEHLYSYINSIEDLEKLKNDPVPNRHAAIHGYITYSTMKNSLNALIMTDYMFQVFTVYKQNQEALVLLSTQHEPA